MLFAVNGVCLSERHANGHSSEALQATEAAVVMEKEVVTCGSHDAPSDNEQNSLDLFASPPISRLKPVVGAADGSGGGSVSGLSSISALNAAYLQYQTSESLSGSADAEQLQSSVIDSGSVLFHSAGSNTGTELHEIDPSQEGGTPECKSNVKDKDNSVIVISDSDESLSGSDEDMPETCDTDYESDFASNRTYFERRRRELGAARGDVPEKISTLSIPERVKMTRARCLRHRLRELKRTHVSRKKRRWRRNKRLRRASAPATASSCVGRKNCTQFPMRRATGRCVCICVC